jgi:hypothetical protein
VVRQVSWVEPGRGLCLSPARLPLKGGKLAGFRGPSAFKAPSQTYAGVAGADLANAPEGPVPFTSPFGLPITRAQVWRAGGTMPGAIDGVPGREVARASGNPDVATMPSYGPESSPYGGDTGPSKLPQFGVYRPLRQTQESAVRAPGDAPVGYSNDKLTTLDRHGIMKTGYENSGRNSGQTDPPMDGPARPSLWLVQRSLSYQQGTDKSLATDDLDRDYTRNAQGMYIGEQGSGWSRVTGGVPGLWQEYGSYQGVSPSSPPIGSDTSRGIHSPVNQGQPGDGPHDVWSGPPHGLHSPTLPTYSQTLGRYMEIPQMARPRIDRPSQSPIAGQSYSQTVLPQGSTGFNKMPQAMGDASFNKRVASNGWRGKAG